MKEKVLMIGPLPPPPGGVATVMQTLLNSNLSNRYDMSALDTARKKRRYKLVDSGGISSLYYLVLNLVKLSYRLYKENPPIIHIQSVTGLALLRDLCFMILGKLWGRKIVFHLHGFYSERISPFKYSILRHFSQFLMKRVDVLILLANTFVPEFDRLLPRTEKVVVPNLMPRNALERSGNVKRHSRSRVDVLFVGRLSQLKGTYDLLKAACIGAVSTPRPASLIRRSDTWIAPLNYDDLHMIWQYAQKEAKGLVPPLSNGKKKKIKAALRDTVETSPTRSRAGAITLIRLLDEQRWGEPLRIHLGGGGQPKREVGFHHRRQRRMQRWSAPDS